MMTLVKTYRLQLFFLDIKPEGEICSNNFVTHDGATSHMILSLEGLSASQGADQVGGGTTTS